MDLSVYTVQKKCVIAMSLTNCLESETSNYSLKVEYILTACKKMNDLDMAFISKFTITLKI